MNLESWENDGLAGTLRAFNSLKASNTGLLTASFSCAYLVSSEFPKSWDGWSPPGNQLSFILVKSTASHNNPHTTVALTSLPPGYLKGWKTTSGAGMKPCSDEHALMPQWFPSLTAGHTSIRTADPGDKPSPVAQTLLAQRALIGHHYLLH